MNLSDLFHFWTVCRLVFSKITEPFLQKSHECALKSTDLWIISLLVDSNYKFIIGSFAFSPGQIYIFAGDKRNPQS